MYKTVCPKEVSKKCKFGWSCGLTIMTIEKAKELGLKEPMPYTEKVGCFKKLWWLKGA